ncbi:MAG: metallophosphoesterase [Bacteroidales bacterium]|jgi:predicted MPP superfamily phosphohydrolase|nr:metallophosphoesterase [Bacteroidales bacterium]
MFLFIFFIASELLVPVVILQHFGRRSKLQVWLLCIVHAALSVLFWALYIKTKAYSGAFDAPANIYGLMLMTGTVSAVMIPRGIFIITHFAGKLLRRKTGGCIKWLTDAGTTIASAVFIIIAAGTLYGRFNVKIDRVEIPVEGLHDDLDGLKIVQISDLHLAGFHSHGKVLLEYMNIINSLAPDLLINTGDFVSYGWREFDSYDTILSRAGSRYGSFAVLGNHDFGTYHPYFNDKEREHNIRMINQKVKSSGYTVLNNEHATVNVGDAIIGIAGVTAVGRHPDISHGSIDSAMQGLGSVDLTIALSHDPNHFAEAIEGQTGIDITLSGHTHGMQMGVNGKRFRWSPSQYLYPHWNGIYRSGRQYHYVNRGL